MITEKGEMVGLGVGGVDGNLIETIRLISDYKMPIEQALLFTTKSVGDALGLKDQGRVEVGACANACLFTEDFTLTHVVARGRVMMRDGEVVVKGTFEI
ncbi:amidohydrolase family protein [Sutterella wadsworthensis]|uniref:amidohydrolase family protein n=1 Tax=Sutterella wadsworthensis TaxID=40545 RepID=UPI00242B3E2F|nr:amidohydrolase family protein [Sutterella wadsworthensis]